MSAGSGKWTPVLDGAVAQSALRLSRQIAQDQALLSGTDDSLQLLAERSLLFSFLAGCDSSSDWAAKAIDSLNVAGTKMSAQISSGLYGGLSGFGWLFDRTVDRLSDLGLMDREQDQIAEIVSILEMRLGNDQFDPDYDLINGLVGIGTFFLGRMHMPLSAQILSTIVARLCDLAQPSPHGTTWFTKPEKLVQVERLKCPHGYYNLGMAHGIAGLVRFLGKYIASGLGRPEHRQLLREGVRWIRAQEQPTGSGSIFAYWVSDSTGIQHSRIGWCYGDLGIGASLYQTGLLLQWDSLAQYGTSILSSCVRRGPEKVSDPGLCHGAIGVAHLYNRLYQDQQVDTFCEMARAYYDLGISMLATKANAVAEPDYSFLSGDIGVGLALLASATSVEPMWDTRLLLS